MANLTCRWFESERNKGPLYVKTHQAHCLLQVPTCLHPGGHRRGWRLIEDLPKRIPGILDLTWGPNLSTEGLDQGFTHSFVMVFKSAAARDAYLPHPEHQAVVQKLMPKLASVIVCDHEFEA